MPDSVIAGAFVPGLPHLLGETPAPGWRALADATRKLGDDLRAAGVETLMIVSSQWYSVLGMQVQVRPELAGTRVDENWYRFDFGTIDFRLKTDVPVADAWLAQLRAGGFQTRPTDHPDFPVDTGVVVATKLLDPQGRMRIAQVSLNLYGTPDSVEKVGSAAAKAAAATGRKVALVAIAGLSSLPLKTWIDPAQDKIAMPAHDQWNRRILDLLRAGKAAEAFALREDYMRAAPVDSQLRPLFFLRGAIDLSRNVKVSAYAPVWGMGAAVISWLQ